MEEHQRGLGGRAPRQTVAHVKDLDGGIQRGQKQEEMEGAFREPEPIGTTVPPSP